MSQDNYAEQLRQKGSHIASDIAGIGAVLKDATSEKLSSIKEAASDKLHSAKDAASERFTAIRDGAVSRAENARDSINEAVTGSPWKSMFLAAGVAAGVGLVAGLFLRRK